MRIAEEKRGFTLIEIVMVITVMSVLATMFASLFGVALKGYEVLDTRKDLVYEAESTLREIASSIRGAKWIEGSLPLSGATEITVMYDIDEDDVVEKVHYYYVEGERELRRKIDDAPEEGVLLAENVDEVSFSGGPALVTILLRLSEGEEEREMRTSAGGRRW